MDYREDKNSDTGLFELIYKQKIPNCQPYLGTALSVQGQKITTNDKKLYIDSKTVPKLPMVNSYYLILYYLMKFIPTYFIIELFTEKKIKY